MAYDDIICVRKRLEFFSPVIPAFFDSYMTPESKLLLKNFIADNNLKKGDTFILYCKNYYCKYLTCFVQDSHDNSMLIISYIKDIPFKIDRSSDESQPIGESQSDA